MELLDLDESGRSPLSTPKTGGRFLWTGKDCLSKCTHNDFPVMQNGHSRYFVIATAAFETTFWCALLPIHTVLTVHLLKLCSFEL